MSYTNQQRKCKAPRSKSMEMTSQKAEEQIFDVFAGATTNNNKNNGAQQSAAPAPPAFKSSLSSFLDGSEFMINLDGAASASASDGETISTEEDARAAAMENAMQKGARMARRCSCPLVGTYEPFDAADPTTWEENKKKKKIRKKSRSPTRSSCSRVSLKTEQERHRERDSGEVKTSRRSRRTTAPMVSSYVLEQQDQAAAGEQVSTNEKGASPASYALLQNDEPAAPEQMVNKFWLVLEEINERKDDRKMSYHVRPSSIPEEDENFGLVLREISKRKSKVEIMKIPVVRPLSDTPEEEGFMLMLKDIMKHKTEVRPTSIVAPTEEGKGFVMVLKDIKKLQKTEKKKKRHRRPEATTTREEEDQMMGKFLLVLEEINSGKKSHTKSTKKKKHTRPRRSISPFEDSSSSLDISSSKSRKSSSTKEKRSELKKERSTRSARGSRSPTRYSLSSPKFATDDEDDEHHSGSRRTKNKDPSRRRITIARQHPW